MRAALRTPPLVDDGLPTLGAALDPDQARDAFAQECAALAHRPRIAEIRVLRHRPSRRCLLRYGFADGTLAVIGKLTCKGVHKRSLAVQARLFAAGFAVPEPLGAVSKLGLWLQREVAGRPLAVMLGDPAATRAAAHAGELLATLHRQPCVDTAAWTIADELLVLNERLAALGRARPDLAARVHRLLEACQCAARLLPKPRVCGIHRDFYPEQVLVAPGRLHLVDFDLYSRGDPALDVGNFIAHLIEAAIRETGDSTSYDLPIRTFEGAYRAVMPNIAPGAIAIFTFLSLARLTQISTSIAARQSATDAILDAAEARAPGSALNQSPD
jgi:aminoglycoside phosphotransferase (APT) family kinase protein